MEKRKIWVGLALNAALLGYACHYFMPIGNLALSFLTCLILFVLPGLAWMGALRKRTFHPAEFILYALSLSLLIFGMGLITQLILKFPVTSVSQLIFLAIAMNVGLCVNDLPRLEFKRPKVLIYIFLGVFLAAYGFSSYVAKAPDRDSEPDLQGTAYSLIHRLTPRMLTDRGTFYNFSHPLLPAVCAAGTILFFDELEHLKYYDSASLAAEEFQRRLDPRRSKWSDPAFIDLSEIRNLIDDSYRRFFESPYLTSTRSAQFLFTALAGVMIFVLILNVTGSFFYGLSGCVFYLTIPEILIGFSSTNYKALGNLTMLMTAYFYCAALKRGQEKSKAPLLLSGFLCALSDHKTVILFAAIVITDLIFALRDRQERSFAKYAPSYSVMGFLAGVFCYWVYGFCVDPRNFFADHFLYHFFNRVMHINEFGYGGYLSVLQLWRTYAAYVGIPVFLLALYVVGDTLRRIREPVQSDILFCFWLAIGAASFSWIDHRQTAHLVFITPALIVLVMTWIPRQGKPLQVLLLTMVCLVLCGHLWNILELSRGRVAIASFAHWLEQS